MTDNPSESISNQFYLVSNLLPANQLLAAIPANTTIAKAIDFMETYGFSQIPIVTTVAQNVIGVFSYRSFCKNLSSYLSVWSEKVKVVAGS